MRLATTLRCVKENESIFFFFIFTFISHMCILRFSFIEFPIKLVAIKRSNCMVARSEYSLLRAPHCGKSLTIHCFFARNFQFGQFVAEHRRRMVLLQPPKKYYCFIRCWNKFSFILSSNNSDSGRSLTEVDRILRQHLIDLFSIRLLCGNVSNNRN